jgi:hypothetical protein
MSAALDAAAGGMMHRLRKAAVRKSTLYQLK